MLIDPFIFFTLIIAAITVSISLIILIASYVKVLKKYNYLLRQQESLKMHDHRKAIEILEKARQKAATLLENQVHNELKTVSLNEIRDFEKAANDLLAFYKQELEDIKTSTIKIASNITKDIESNTISELKDFKEILQKETYASQKIVEEKVEEEYSEMKKELEAYRQERLKKIEDEIYNIIQDVSMLVLGRSLSVRDHEELILEALEKAKKKKVL